MLAALRHRRFAALFGSQVASLLGTGILTVAVALLAARLAGDDAGQVLGIALTIRIATYVVVSPIATALLAGRSSRAILIGADLARVIVAIGLVLVTETWQLYLAILLLQSASAVFTPTYQAVIPEVLPDEDDYTAAQSLSRLAYDLESLVSPLIAAALVLVLAPSWLFAITALGLVLSVLAVVMSGIRLRTGLVGEPFSGRLTRGLRLIAATPSLRFLAILDAVVAAVFATVLVNTVVIVLRLQGDIDEIAGPLALGLALFGAGSMLVALVLPAVLRRVADRTVMLSGAGLAIALLAVVGAVELTIGLDLVGLAVCWFGLGAAASATSTPSARLIRRDAVAADRPAVFAARFSTSHAWYALTYPLAGVGGAVLGLGVATSALAGLALLAVVAALFAAPRRPAPARVPPAARRPPVTIPRQSRGASR